MKNRITKIISLATEGIWEKEHIFLEPAPISVQSAEVNSCLPVSLLMLLYMDAGLYSVPNGFMHTSNPKSASCLPMLSVKQLPSIIILSL